MTMLDTVTGLEMVIKRSAELIPVDFIFPNLANGETIASINSVAQANRGNVAGSVALTIGNQSHDNLKTVQVWLSVGTNDEFYCMTISVTTSTGAVRSCSGVVWIKDPC